MCGLQGSDSLISALGAFFIPLFQCHSSIEEYFAREVLPHVPDAWIDYEKTVRGYEISFTKYFYNFKPLRSLEDIKAEILALEAQTEGVLRQIIEAE